METWLTKVKKDFQCACDLSAKAPENQAEPYREKYRAKELFECILKEISNFPDCETVISALLHYQIAVICLDTEEPAAGEQHLTTALQLMSNVDTIKYSLLMINIYNQLGILWTVRKELEKAEEYLKKAEELYKSIVRCQEVQTFAKFFDFDQAITDPDGERELNQAFAHTLYYLAQVYGHLENIEAAAGYCFQTLKWQIDHKLSFDPLEWSLNSATLSQYFITKEQFTVARHLLSCSSFNLSQSCEKEDPDEDNYQHTKADVLRYWGKYGLALLNTSTQRLVDNVNDLRAKDHASTDKNFTLLDSDLSQWEQKITDNYIVNYDGARDVFLHAQKCFNSAKEYYTLNDNASDYIGIVQNISEIYKLLSFFETSCERSCKMFKRRADLLEETLNALNKKYYLNECRQLHFELAEIYSEMMDMKRKQKEKNIAADQQSINKINMLIEKSLQHFFAFIESLEEKGALPTRLSDDLVRPGLLAHFYIARLYSKFIVGDAQMEMENLKSSEKYYNFVASYIKRNPDQEHFIKEELDVITEMLKLLPQRILMFSGQ